MDEIETNMKSLIADKAVSYKCAIGGGYYVSVTSGFYCVDIRKFFVPFGQTEIKPTRRGLALRLREWSDWKKTWRLSTARIPLSAPLCRVTWAMITRTRLVRWNVASATPSFATSSELY